MFSKSQKIQIFAQNSDCFVPFWIKNNF